MWSSVLKGIFSRVELVILVGVGGSIPGRPNNTVERGDVVVSQPEFQGGPLYVHCTGKQFYIYHSWDMYVLTDKAV